MSGNVSHYRSASEAGYDRDDRDDRNQMERDQVVTSDAPSPPPLPPFLKRQTSDKTPSNQPEVCDYILEADEAFCARF